MHSRSDFVGRVRAQGRNPWARDGLVISSYKVRIELSLAARGIDTSPPGSLLESSTKFGCVIGPCVSRNLTSQLVVSIDLAGL